MRVLPIFAVCAALSVALSAGALVRAAPVHPGCRNEVFTEPHEIFLDFYDNTTILKDYTLRLENCTYRAGLVITTPRPSGTVTATRFSMQIVGTEVFGNFTYRPHFFPVAYSSFVFANSSVRSLGDASAATPSAALSGNGFVSGATYFDGGAATASVLFDNAVFEGPFRTTTGVMEWSNFTFSHCKFLSNADNENTLPGFSVHVAISLYKDTVFTVSDCFFATGTSLLMTEYFLSATMLFLRNVWDRDAHLPIVNGGTPSLLLRSTAMRFMNTTLEGNTFARGVAFSTSFYLNERPMELEGCRLGVIGNVLAAPAPWGAAFLESTAIATTAAFTFNLMTTLSGVKQTFVDNTVIVGSASGEQQSNEATLGGVVYQKASLGAGASFKLTGNTFYSAAPPAEEAAAGAGSNDHRPIVSLNSTDGAIISFDDSNTFGLPMCATGRVATGTASIAITNNATAKAASVVDLSGFAANGFDVKCAERLPDAAANYSYACEAAALPGQCRGTTTITEATTVTSTATTASTSEATTTTTATTTEDMTTTAITTETATSEDTTEAATTEGSTPTEATNTVEPATTSAHPNTTQPSGDGDDGSRGKKVAIGVSVGAACVALPAIAFFFIWRRRAARQRAFDGDVLEGATATDQPLPIRETIQYK